MNTKYLRKAQQATDPSKRRRHMRHHRALKIKDTIAQCVDCPLAKTRINTVPFDNWKPVPLAIVGEAPGAKEDKEGVPFVGRSGRLLDSMIEDTGNSRSDVAVLNTVACRPPKNRRPTRVEAETCRPHFDKQLDFTGAWVVVLLGNAALSQFRPEFKITEARGTPFWLKGRIFIPTFHPSYVLRNGKHRAITTADLRLAFDIVNGEKWWEPRILTELASEKEYRDMMKMVQERGWAHHDSFRLSDRVVVVRDDMVKVPTKYVSAPRYTVEELVRIGELGRGVRISTPELQAVHLVKRLGGVVVR